MAIVIDPSALTTITLQSYITDAQRLLHDSSYNFWSQQELTDYANKARRRVASDTGCLRQLAAGVVVDAGTNSFDFLAIANNRRVIGILDIYWYYSPTTRYALLYHPYSAYSRLGSVMYQYNGIPTFWSQLGQTAYVSPTPQQGYTADFDCVIEPLDLVNLTDVDSEIVSPFSEAVAFYMCYLAKMKDQRRQQAEEFLLDYKRQVHMMSNSTIIRRLVGA